MIENLLGPKGYCHQKGISRREAVVNASRGALALPGVTAEE